ncbi:hypothetical protein TSUD_148210 [Trifolium subterraneum]|uniref:Uncharacterized protein n=1 Tax=Trifolium subterraneum TaxID=3900 RepID=A0A2Z6MJB9_TRISU|nr:hypothetical protein TSUD_148210 [Trifolium subterraneum]
MTLLFPAFATTIKQGDTSHESAESGVVRFGGWISDTNVQDRFQAGHTMVDGNTGTTRNDDNRRLWRIERGGCQADGAIVG